MYAVIFIYSFDWDVAVYLFEDLEEAKEFLKSSAEEEYRIDTEENGWTTELEFDNDNCYAKITNHFLDRDDITEMHIGNIYSK